MTTQTPDQPNITTVLAQVASDVVGELEMEKLLPKILATTMNTLKAEVCSIYLRDPTTNRLRCEAGEGFATEIKGKEYEWGQGLTGTVAKEGKPYNIRSREERDRLKSEGKLEGRYDSIQWSKDKGREFRNLLAFPLKIKKADTLETLGVIKVENKKDADHFDDQDEEIFAIIANVIALAIENANSHKKAEQQSRAIYDALAEIAGSVVGSLKMNELLNQIILTTMKTLHAEVCSIFLEDKEKKPGYIRCVAGSGFAKRIEGVAEYKAGDGFTGHVFQTGDSYNIKNRQMRQELIDKGIWKQRFDKQQWQGGEDKFRNLLALPLQIKDEILGVIKVENKEVILGDHFTDEDFTIFRTIANVIALAIQNARLATQTEVQLKSISVQAAHRINNQMTGYDFVELMLKGEAEGNKPANKKELLGLSERVGEITRNVKRMIQEFKDFGKPYELRLEKASLNEVLQKAVNDAKVGEGNIEISLSDRQVPSFTFDKGRFSESITELLRNAKRAIAENKKGGHIWVSTEFLPASESGNKRDSVRIVIEDDGPGFPSKIKVFEPFQTTNTQSTGLGLSTVKDLVEKHGGTVTLKKSERSEACGACFEIILPIERN